MASQEPTSVPDPNGDTKPSFRSRTSRPRPRRGDPIAKVGNPVEKRSHRNQYTKNPKKGEGQSGSKRKIQPNWKCAHTGKDSDQLGKNAGTSHKEP